MTDVERQLRDWMKGLREQFLKKCRESLGERFEPKRLFTETFGDDANMAAKQCAVVAQEVFGVDMMDHHVHADDFTEWLAIPESMYADRYKTAEHVFQTARRRLLSR